MNDKEFENLIKDTLHSNESPTRESLSYILSNLDRTPVTNIEELRYNTQTIKSNIINNKIADVISIWISKRIVLVPSLILLLFIGVFSLSPRVATKNQSLQQLVAQDALFEDLEVDTVNDLDDEAILTSFDEQAFNELSAI